MKKILVPIDFSVQSEYAMKLVSKITNETEIEVHLLHLLELPKGHVDMGSGSNFGIPQSMFYIQKIKEKISKLKKEFFSTDTKVKYAIRFEKPAEGILKFSKKINADLILMGSKERTIFDELLISSNIKRVVRESKAPILVVKNDPQDFNIKELVFASNFNEEDRKSFEVLLNFSQKFESKIHLLNVNTMNRFKSTKKARQKMESFLSAYQDPKHSINVYNDDSVENGILNFSKEINADLIALSTHERSGLFRLFNKSISKSLSKSSLKPVITFLI
ncbi:Universal stress protein [Polaribacter huanghezhanensis]|uniref:universal stress protein n=1 Tax=Polaribacter huanghezhanensis TaxID=1354726 RepID=UPI002649F7CA|nr:universal stress protein [Polaribacter huanghezhanensis]WKD85731.1 Universal stress protein [Polaribacter huanghezhanensis]